MPTRIKYPLAVAIAAGAVAALGQGAPASAAAPATPARPGDRPVIAYVLETPPCMGNTVSVINTATNTALKPVTVGLGVNAIAVTPNGKTVYVSSGARITSGTVCGSGGPQTGANTVTPINTATNKPGKPINAGESPGTIAITPDGKTAYVLSQRGVVPISTATNKPGKPVNAGKDLTGIAITPNGKTAYVVSTFSATVTPIRTATNTALKAITIGTPPAGYEFPDQIAITPDSRTAYVSTTAGVVPIRTATNTALKLITVGNGPGAIAITPDGKTAYVSTTAGVVPIRTATNTALKLIKIGNGQPAQPGPSPIAITPNGKTAYVVNLIAGTVTPISTATNTPGRPVVVKSSPGVLLDGIGITPDGRTAYILNEIFEPASFPGTVIPLRTATNTLGKPITVGTAPSAIVFAS